MPISDTPAETTLNVEQLTADIKESRLRNSELTQENAALATASKNFAGMEQLVAQLREANQHLVIATVEAQTLRDEAQAANARQREFLAMLAHELRNPLAPISMAAKLIGQIPNATPQLLKLQMTISRQAAHLSRLLNDLLDAARISSGKVTLQLEPVLLSDVLERAVEVIRPQLATRRQHFELRMDAEGVVIAGDQVRLAQVFANLLINASNYTQNGGRITLLATRSGDQVTIFLSDNGQGIAPEVLPHIFDMFTQGPRSLDRTDGGLGIGLSVVCNIVEMHHGTVTASSSGLGNGSTFTVTLPVSGKPEEFGPSPSLGQEADGAYRILVVEDNRDANYLLTEILGLEGHVVNAAYDGPTGLAMARANIYDVLICDIGLPGMNGFDLLVNLRESIGASMPFAIALSGYGQSEDRDRAVISGFNHYFVKPVNVEALTTLISSSAVADLVASRN